MFWVDRAAKCLLTAEWFNVCKKEVAIEIEKVHRHDILHFFLAETKTTKIGKKWATKKGNSPKINNYGVLCGQNLK